MSTTTGHGHRLPDPTMRRLGLPPLPAGVAAVSDTSPVIHLTRIGRLDVLRSAGTTVTIPPAVLTELRAG